MDAGQKQTIMKMAGKYATHAMWSIADGEDLIPLLAYQDHGNQQRLERLVMDVEMAWKHYEERLPQLASDGLGAVFIFNVIVTLEAGETEALSVTIRFPCEACQVIQLILPYRSASHKQGFRPEQLLVTGVQGCAREEMETLMDAFTEGMKSHSQGEAIWKVLFVSE